MEEKFVIKVNDVYLGETLGVYADSHEFGTANFYGNIMNAQLLTKDEVDKSLSILGNHFPDVHVVPIEIKEKDVQQKLFNEGDSDE